MGSLQIHNDKLEASNHVLVEFSVDTIVEMFEMGNERIKKSRTAGKP